MYDNLFNQFVDISKASSYDILAQKCKEQELLIVNLESENRQLEIKLKGAEARIAAMQEFIGHVKSAGSLTLELPNLGKTVGENDADDIKGVL